MQPMHTGKKWKIFKAGLLRGVTACRKQPKLWKLLQFGIKGLKNRQHLSLDARGEYMKVKKIIYGILTGVMIMNSIGCENVISHEQQAIKMLNEKYNDTFEIESVQSQSFSGGYYTVIAYQEEDSTLLFRADIDSDGTGLSDNYVTRILCRDMSEQVAWNLNSLPGTYYIYVEAMFEPTMLKKPGITLKEFMEETPKNKFTINVNYAPEGASAQEVYGGLTNILQNMENISGKIHLYIMDETNIAVVQEYMETHDRCYDEFEDMVESYSVGLIDFENGVITTAKEEVIRMLGNRL